LKGLTEQDQHKDKNDKNNIKELDNYPIQLIEQLKGYYYINPFLA
jgi:hypothetical protein